MSSVAGTGAWYPDPSDPTMLRWWDGNEWTADTRPALSGESPVSGHTAVGLGGLNLRNVDNKASNHYSLMTFGVAALYLILAFFTHFVLVGFVPLAMSMRAKRSGEPLAPLAIAAAIGVILISVLTLLH